jgi:outer membrane biosynthesis protein TonB
VAASFYRDDPWRRMPAEVVAALLLTLLALILFDEFLTANNYTLTPPKPVEMRIIVLPPTPAPAPAAPAAPAETLPPQRRGQLVTPPAPLQPLQEAVPQQTRRAAEAAPVYPAPPKPKPAPLPSERAQAVPKPAAPVAPVITPPRARAPAAAPPAATAPLTAAEQQMIAARRKKMAEELYQPGGHGATGDDERQRRGENQGYAPPLSPEEWKALDEVFFVGAAPGGNFISKLAEWAPMRAAMSPHAPPLTRDQWDALDRIYHVGGYERYQEYREALARAHRTESLATLADLTPDEREFILASRGVLPLSHGPTLHMSYKLKLIDGTYMAAYNQRGAPPVVLHAVSPELPETLLKPPAQWNAVVRLQIDRLASTRVELTGSTGNDTVDRALLDALRSWRFRSAFYGFSLPMASTDELRISLIVK